MYFAKRSNNRWTFLRFWGWIVVTERFHCKSYFDATAAEVFAWHEAPGAFERLSPPWVSVECVERTGTIADGRVVLSIKQGPIGIPWVLAHRNYIDGRQFCDYQLAGPFASWEHTHLVEPLEDGERCFLSENIDFELPAGLMGRLAGGLYMRGELRRLFTYRHELMRRDLAFKHKYGAKKMRFLVSGSTGLVGSQLVPFLRTQGHEVFVLVRRKAETPFEIYWEPNRGELGAPLPENLDAIIHLSGHNVAKARWTQAEKQLILESRVKSTAYIAKLAAEMKNPPGALILASAVGYYGNRGSEPLTEDSAAGDGFLAEVCKDWEMAAQAAQDAHIRVAFARIGAVLHPNGGALAKLLPVFSAGGGGPVGDGKQYFPWVSMDDVLGSLYHAAVDKHLSGPFNVVSPGGVTNGEFSRVLGRALGRPSIIPAPAQAIRLAFGEMGEALILASVRVLPQRLKQAGYKFVDEDLAGALRHMLGKAKPHFEK